LKESADEQEFAKAKALLEFDQVVNVPAPSDEAAKAPIRSSRATTDEAHRQHAATTMLAKQIAHEVTELADAAVEIPTRLLRYRMLPLP
jgi:hypothetical protein